MTMQRYDFDGLSANVLYSPTALLPSFDPDYPFIISTQPPRTIEGDIRFSLVVPTYNEGNNIKSLIGRLSKRLEDILGDAYELIVVDDNSPDRTWEIALGLVEQYPALRVMHRTKERGLSTAVIRGWQVARGDVLGVIDGDLQHPPDIFLKLLDQIESGADLAIGSRHIEGGGVSSWSFIRRFLSRGAQMLGLLLVPDVLGRVSDPMSVYFVLQRQAISGRTLNPVGYKILLEVIGRGRIGAIAEVGYVVQEHVEGESVTSTHYIDYIRHLLRLRLALGIRSWILGLWQQRQIRRLFQFGMVGFSGVFVDMGILYLLHDPSTLGLGLTTSKIIASEIAIINNFIWNDAWTFADVSQQQQEWPKRLKRFAKFNSVCGVGLVINLLLLNLLFNIFGVYYLLANLIAIATVTFWNFWINLKLSWRVTAR
ncbi:MAG: glycosyltransferase [Leptolyngbyaceae bacterium]|nr:glycosyltransferase [Leptolyngbyaceae bacterium]